MRRRRRRCESGLSLAEALVALGLLCIFIVPAVSMIRQSVVSYSHAYAAYQTDLTLCRLLAQAKNSAETTGFANIAMDFSDYADNDGFEYEIIIQDLHSGQIRVFRYPNNNGLSEEPAAITQTGDFTGLITAAVKDIRTGIVKINALPF